MAYRVVNELDSSSASDPLTITSSNANTASPQKEGSAKGSNAGTAGIGSIGGVGLGISGGKGKMDEEEERDAVFFRLEMLGYRVGQGLVERFVSHFFLY